MARIAEGIADSSPYNVIAVTTAKPELFMVKRRFCAIVIFLSSFIILHISS